MINPTAIEKINSRIIKIGINLKSFFWNFLHIKSYFQFATIPKNKKGSIKYSKFSKRPPIEWGVKINIKGIITDIAKRIHLGMLKLGLSL